MATINPELIKEVDELCKKYGIESLEYIGTGRYVTNYLHLEFLKEIADGNGIEICDDIDIEAVIQYGFDMHLQNFDYDDTVTILEQMADDDSEPYVWWQLDEGW